MRGRPIVARALALGALFVLLYVLLALVFPRLALGADRRPCGCYRPPIFGGGLIGPLPELVPYGPPLRSTRTGAVAE